MVLWFRSDLRVIRRISYSIGLVTLTFVELFSFYGLRVEMGGSGAAPILTFHDPDSHFDEIEQRQQGGEAGTVEAASRPSIEGGAYWTDFRGPNRDGHYEERSINTNWKDGQLPELWRQKIGGGYASVVVAEGRVFTIEQRRDQETVACYDLGSGKELWVHAWDAFFQEGLGGDGPRATPTWHEGRVYALGGGGRSARDRRGNRPARLGKEHPLRQRRIECYLGDVGLASDCRREGYCAPRGPGRPLGRRLS